MSIRNALNIEYNCCVRLKLTIRWLLLLALLAGQALTPPSAVLASPPAQSGEVTAFDLIIAMNTLRASLGLPALVEDPIVDAVAQSTAEIMAANQMSWHIGDVSGRLAAAGYGGGAKVWATENFATGNYSIDEIMLIWSDESHMIPAVNPAYCHIGAGVASSSNGRKYYVLQAAYVAGKSCGEYKSSGGTTTQPGGSTDQGRESSISQLIVPVKIATPDADGNIYHVVQAGQSFWAIAIAYKITIKDIETFNNISRESKLQVGQRLFIPGKNTKGYATPTPVGMIQVSTPDADGKIIHTVQAYQTLSTISQAYGTSIERILSLNGLQVDWPLLIDQKLLIHPGNVTPSPTPRPLTPIEKLTPESDGNYYHTVKSGETLSWIAGLYEISVTDLMNWNGLGTTSIIHPEQKLVLQVTLPATQTSTPGPPTATLTPTAAAPTLTPILISTTTVPSPPSPAAPSSTGGGTSAIWFVSIGLAAGALVLGLLFSRRKQ
jgi:LPXTG-motif cell wall-anchored protein